MIWEGWLRKWAAIREPKVEHLFHTKGNLKQLSTTKLREWLIKKIVATTGMSEKQAKEYGIHGMRKGGASEGNAFKAREGNEGLCLQEGTGTWVVRSSMAEIRGWGEWSATSKDARGRGRGPNVKMGEDRLFV